MTRTAVFSFLAVHLTAIALAYGETAMPDGPAGIGVVSDRAAYQFDGRISREVLEAYLSRAITMMGLSRSDQRAEDIRMLTNIGAKFVGRVAYLWDDPGDDDQHFREAKETADLLHQADPDLLLEACVFEAVFEGVDQLRVPPWVFEAFGMRAEQRNFNYQAMIYENGELRLGDRAAVPDMSRLETRMWFYYRARRYIDSGYEALHFGQIHLMDANDPDHRYWLDMLTRVRAYGAQHARRHLVLCNAHTHGVVVDGKLLFDFHEYPSRPIEVLDSPQKTVLRVNPNPEIGTPHDEIYGDSKGGETPSGWKCEHLPYLVELDNDDPSGREGQPNVPWYVWGYDEIRWFAHQPSDYRNEWLRYAWSWLRENDANGWLEMPGRRGRYHANNPSEAAPQGGGQEDTIKAIWAGRDAAGRPRMECADTP